MDGSELLYSIVMFHMNHALLALRRWPDNLEQIDFCQTYSYKLADRVGKKDYFP